MHELSIAHSLVETAVATAHAHQIHQVDSVHLRLGVMAGVVKEALLFGYDIASANTVLAGSRLEIEELPLMIRCPRCHTNHTLPATAPLVCPACHTPTSHIIQGKELELVSLRYHDEPTPA